MNDLLSNSWISNGIVIIIIVLLILAVWSKVKHQEMRDTIIEIKEILSEIKR